MEISANTTNLIVIVLGVATLIVAVVAAVYAILPYELKSGIDVRGSYSIMRSVAAEDPYIGSVTLENLKDRAVVIFKIFLELNHGYFVEIADFENEPLILRPFEVFRREYGPLDQYLAGLQRIRIDKLFDAKSRRRGRLVLSTTSGRYRVAAHIPRWDPVSDFFRNHLTAVIHPLRLMYEGKPYGSGTKYIVKFKTTGRPDEIVPIYPHDCEVKKFRSFQLTADALTSRDALEHFLYEQATSGKLRCTDLEVFDMEQWRTEVLREYKGDVIDAAPRNWFIYHILGRALTKWSDLRLWQKNRATRREYKKRKAESEGNATTGS